MLLLIPLNRDCLSFCVIIFTFRGYRSFRLCKTIGSQGPLFVVVIWWLKIICDKNCGSVTQNCILISKTQCFCSSSLFFTCFFLIIFFHFHCNLQLIYTLGVYFCSVVLVVTKHSSFIRCQGSLFSWCRPRGAQNVSVVQISFFSKTFFYFCLLFSCWLSGCSNVADLHQITAFGSRQGEFIGPAGGVSGRCFY